MSETSLLGTVAVGIKPEVAALRIASFEKRFGKAHLYFAYHAAFPIALTPELLYRLWANFQQDIHGQALDIPGVAVADLLLSRLCEEVGYKMYEMDVAIRNELLSRLKKDENFGQKRIKELSDFLLSYIQPHFHSDDPDLQDFAESQWFTALAYTSPHRAAYELALTLARLHHSDTTEMVRMQSLVETLAEPLAEKFKPLLIYVRGMASFDRGDLNRATSLLGEVVDLKNRIRIAGVILSIPQKIKKNIETLQSSTKKDYSRTNLRGRSFKGQNLTGADFSYSDIRGADFTNATLIGANFSHAKAGLQRRWATILIICSILLSALSGVASIFIGLVLESALFRVSPVSEIHLFSVASLILFLLFCVVIIRQGIEATIGAVALVMPGILTVVAAVTGAITGTWSWLVGVALALPGILAVVAACTGARAGFLRFAGAWGAVLVVGMALALAFVSLLDIVLGLFSTEISTLSASPWLTSAHGILMPVSMSVIGLVVVGVALTWALALVLAGTVSRAWALVVGLVLALAWFLFLRWTWTTGVGVTTTEIVGVVPGLGAYIAWRTLAGDDKYAFVWTAAMLFIAIGSTRFGGANLANANFTQATLKSADFRKANLTQTCWLQTNKLQLAHSGESYLKYQQMRRLVITGVGKGKNFDHLNLRGLNLCGANLADASFIGTDLCEANLQDADLSGTKLVETKLDQADLTGAYLTGACIQNWKITSSTQLDGIECDYVYMQLPTKENPDLCRQPEDEYEIFEIGDFADFIRS